MRMEPGRELDTLVVTKVLGLHEEAGWWKDNAGEIKYPACVGCMGESTWSPSTDIAAAFAIDKLSWLWEFQESPETLTVELYTSFALRREVIEMYPILPKKVILVRQKWLDDKARTYAWLRCLAALEAVGVEIIHVPEGESITLSSWAVLENVAVVGVEVDVGG